MQIVTDSGMDAAPEQLAGLPIHQVPLHFTLDGVSYRSGIDIQAEEFYRLLDKSNNMPITSQPSPGEFADLYRKLAAQDPEILSVHISSGLSGSLNAAREGAKLVPEAHVTFFDSKTLSGALGWQVEAAGRAAKAGWSVPETVALLEKVRAATDTLFTIATLKYLIHGGRISHIKGLLASVLNIKPIIYVEKERGIYVQAGQTRTLNRAIAKMADIIATRITPGTSLRVQTMHGNNTEGSMMIREYLEKLFPCTWLPINPVAPALGAHTGSGLVGIVFALQAVFPALP